MIFRYGLGQLMAPAGTAGAGAGGGAGDQPPLTMEGILAEVDKRLTAQISAGIDKFKKDNEAAIDSKLAPLSQSLTGISEALGKITGGTGGNPNAGGGTGAPGNQPPNNLSPQDNVLLKQLQDTTRAQGQQIETLKKEKQEADQKAERSDRHSIIRSALGNMHFISDMATSTAFTIVEPHIKRLEDGSLIGGINGDNLPVDAFVKDYLTREHSYLLLPSGATGSGATSTGGSPRMGIKADLSDIKVGMKPETRESVVASISAALAGVNG